VGTQDQQQRRLARFLTGRQQQPCEHEEKRDPPGGDAAQRGARQLCRHDGRTAHRPGGEERMLGKLPAARVQGAPPEAARSSQERQEEQRRGEKTQRQVHLDAAQGRAGRIGFDRRQLPEPEQRQGKKAERDEGHQRQHPSARPQLQPELCCRGGRELLGGSPAEAL
jgi:hypothetical protein